MGQRESVETAEAQSEVRTEKETGQASRRQRESRGGQTGQRSDRGGRRGWGCGKRGRGEGGRSQTTVVRTVPRTSLEQLGLDAVKLGVPSVWSVWVGVDSDRLSGGEWCRLPPG